MDPVTFPASSAVRVQITIAVGHVRVREQSSAVAVHVTGEKDPDQVEIDSSVDADGSLRRHGL